MASTRPPQLTRSWRGHVPKPVGAGQLHVTGTLRDGGTVRATGLTWRAGSLPTGDKLLTFAVSYTWQSCAAKCVRAADTTATPFAAQRYIVAHADTSGGCGWWNRRQTVEPTRPFLLHPGQRVGDRDHPGRGRRLRRRPAAADRIRERAAGAADRVRLRVPSGRSGALPRGRRGAGRQLPDRPRALDHGAVQPPDLHRRAGHRPPPRARAQLSTAMAPRRSGTAGASCRCRSRSRASRGPAANAGTRRT